MQNLTTNQIRDCFIEFFKKHEHQEVQSSSLIPHNDPSLMFVNSGMVQFKNIFTGVEEATYKRAASSQKVVRAGGKHNDLDNVGYTARHHTFFEMLGNFSFGDYFKEQAIYYAWQFLTDELGIDKNRLYVTVYHTDLESRDYWKKISSMKEERIISISTNDNFWSMGDTGPCGPCSEIFYDHGDHIFGGLPGTKNEGGDRYVEIWNLVFMQFESMKDGSRILLPKKSVDTGMGLERIASVMQNVHDNYQTDILHDIMIFAESVMKTKIGKENFASYKVIADHLRSISFLLADGIMPSNEGRGYVLRRIIRRAVRHAHILGVNDAVLYKLLPKIVSLYNKPYPELNRSQEFIGVVLKHEEENFRKTLDRGLILLDKELENLPKNSKLPGDVAFKLYDTYGFPVDLTKDILSHKNIEVDMENFNKMMTDQKQKARASWKGSGEVGTSYLWFTILEKFGPTEFLGYNSNKSDANVIGLILNDNFVNEITKSDFEFTLLANQTVFYAESGGQMGDIGYIINAQCKIKVINTIKYLGKIHAHICLLEHGSIKLNDIITLNIDAAYRNGLRIHHSATHILHSVMKNILGKHIVQKGSLVAYDRLRFDVSHTKPISEAEIKLIEYHVNKIIIDNTKVVTRLMSLNNAIDSGATALFGEKYEDIVRVVSIGSFDNTPEIEECLSVELCGGTHVDATGDMGFFKIISTSSIGSGLRRIEAKCGIKALEYIQEEENLINQLLKKLSTNKAELYNKIENIFENNKKMDKEIVKLLTENLILSANESINNRTKCNKCYLIYHNVDNVDSKIIHNVVQQIKRKYNDSIIVCVNKLQNKLSIIIGVGDSVIYVYDAFHIAENLVKIIGGNASGRGDIAQISNIDVSKLSEIENELICLINTE